jgi:hypothetical protein
LKPADLDPRELLDNGKFLERSGIGSGVLDRQRLVHASALNLSPKKVVQLLVRFDVSRMRKGYVAVLHFMQADRTGRPEGGFTLGIKAPTS